MDKLRKALAHRLLMMICSQDERDVDDVVEMLDWYIEAKLKEKNGAT